MGQLISSKLPLPLAQSITTLKCRLRDLKVSESTSQDRARSKYFWKVVHRAKWGQSELVVSVALPAEPRAEKKLFFVQILGGEKLLKFGEKWAVKNF